MRRLLSLACVLLLPATIAAQAVAPSSRPLGDMLTRGPHEVVARQDSVNGLRYAYWFPAMKTGAKMTFGRYLGSAAQEFRTLIVSAGVQPADADALLATRTVASSTGTRVRELSDVLLIAQGNAQDVQDQAIFAEFMASHGLVVVTTPSPMLRSPMTDVAEIANFAERQANELEAARNAVAATLALGKGRIFVAGHSFGARAALFYAMQHPEVDGIISLDGGIGTSVGVDVMRSARSFDSLRVLPPILHVYETQDAFLSPNLDFLLGLRTQRLELVRLDALHHVHFTSTGFVAVVSPPLAKATRADSQLSAALRQLGDAVVGFVARIRSKSR